MAEKINSRQKGARNERAVAKLFSDWTGYEFARTPQSGGLHWKKQHTTGDIVCIDENHGRRFPFSIECKFHQDLDFSYLLDDTKGKNSKKILYFWEQTLEDAKTSGKLPLLTMRRNGMTKDSHFIVTYSNFLKPILSNKPDIHCGLGVMVYVNRGSGLKLIIMNSIDFFKLPYKEIYKKARKYLKNGKK